MLAHYEELNSEIMGWEHADGREIIPYFKNIWISFWSSNYCSPSKCVLFKLKKYIRFYIWKETQSKCGKILIISKSR